MREKGKNGGKGKERETKRKTGKQEKGTKEEEGRKTGEKDGKLEPATDEYRLAGFRRMCGVGCMQRRRTRYPREPHGEPVQNLVEYNALP